VCFHAPAHLLLLDGDPAQRRQVGRVIERVHSHVLTAASVARARALIDDERVWAGFIVAHRLPGARGVDFLAEVRERFPSVPLALITAEPSHELAGRCVLLNAAYLLAPIRPEVVRTIARRAARAAAGLRWPTFEAFVRRAGLSDRERAVAERSLVERMTKSEIAAALDLSRHTVKTHVRNVLTKAHAESMDTLRGQILALRPAHPHPPG